MNIFIHSKQQEKMFEYHNRYWGGLEKKTKVVHIFKLCLEVGATLANQDDYFNIGGDGLKQGK